MKGCIKHAHHEYTQIGGENPLIAREEEEEEGGILHLLQVLTLKPVKSLDETTDFCTVFLICLLPVSLQVYLKYF